MSFAISVLQGQWGIMALDGVIRLGAIALLIPVGVLWTECVAAALPERSRSLLAASSCRVDILMPAHNEARGIAPVLHALLPQLGNQDRLVVIADNCTDETAAIARAAGATVLERWETERRGKGYALDYGIRALAADPPDVVILMDADCMAQPGTLDQIADLAHRTARPIQAVYLMEQPPQSTPTRAISALAFLVKNQVRPQGLERLGLPCLLTGTGMAFPWAVIQKAPLASSNLVEDMQLGLDLAIAGYPPRLCPTAQVLGCLPLQESAATSQRTRWEHGHLTTLKTQVPRLLAAAITQRRFDLLALALDLSVPPLSLLVMLWLGLAIAATVLLGLGGSSLPLVVTLIQAGLMGMAIAIAWSRFGQSVLPAKHLLSIPLYLLWKIPLYLKFIVRPQRQWVRTERD